jgi:hypothetical protein
MEREKMEERIHHETDYTGHSEKQLDIAVDKPKNMVKQSQTVMTQPIFQNNTKTIYTGNNKKKK